MKKIKTTIVVAAVALVPAAMQAQSDELGSWTSIAIDKKLSKPLTLGAEVELRTGNNLKNVDRWSAGISADYRLTKWLKASAGYTFLYDYHPETYTYQDDGDLNKRTMSYFGPRHRLSASLTASHDFGRLSISLRERWQYTYRPEQADLRMDYQHASLGYSYPVKGKAKNVWRNRLQLKYKTDGLLRPYLYGETYVGGSGFDKLRLALGTELKLSKKSALNIGYVFQRPFNDEDEPANKHILNVGYKLDL